MWTIEDSAFESGGDQLLDAQKALQAAREQHQLTLVVGNGPSQSAAWLHARRNQVAESDISWSAVIKAAAVAHNLDDLIDDHGNNLALAQAVLLRGGQPQDSRRSLLGALETAFRQEIGATAIDDMLVDLRPKAVVTTNYDFQVERAFSRHSAPWLATVRHSQFADTGEVTRIHKMHGSFAPANEVSANYLFPLEWEDANRSVVITEDDYDECYQQLGTMDCNDASLLGALTGVCLIVGKSLDPQDISYMFALRRSRPRRPRAFMLFDRLPSTSDRVGLHNLNITPLVLNLPRALPRSGRSGYYYFGVAAALAQLFPDLARHFESAKSDPCADFEALVRGPQLLAIGLASRNLTGITRYAGKNRVPGPGRRNLAYQDVEEHIGGAALTPLLIFSALNCEGHFEASLCSAIGRPPDGIGDRILADARDLGINVDAVSRNQAASWDSTVLVHTSEDHDGHEYPGQRIFLDRGYNTPVRLEVREEEQLRIQLRHPGLRAVYLDKFMAVQHPPVDRVSKIDTSRFGPLLQQKNLAVLSEVLEARPELDLVYETGGGGSPFQHVEQHLSPYINVFTAGFPFFANLVLQRLDWELPASLVPFEPNGTWWQADFKEETRAIHDMLPRILGHDWKPDPERRLWRFDVDPAVWKLMAFWAGRSGLRLRRRWFIATLHHFGALGIDLKNNAGWYCSAPSHLGRSIENTSGAGDAFRGALLYALLCSTRFDASALAVALRFSTDVASKRCESFKIADASAEITAQFAGNYELYEALDDAQLVRTGSVAPRANPG